MNPDHLKRVLNIAQLIMPFRFFYQIKRVSISLCDHEAEQPVTHELLFLAIFKVEHPLKKVCTVIFMREKKSIRSELAGPNHNTLDDRVKQFQPKVSAR